MVVGSFSWLSYSDRKRSKENHQQSYRFFFRQYDKLETLGILAFDTAKTMSRLVSLYRSLSDDEINRFREHVLNSQAVLYLNSEDEGYLLTLACAERLEDLDRAANAVARLGVKCADNTLNRFDHVYRDLKLGYVDVDKMNFGVKDVDKAVDKMEKMVSSTSNLYAELQTLTEMEISERKMNDWRKKNLNADPSQLANLEIFEQKVNSQRKQVRQLKEISLWNKSFDNSVALMARTVCVVYAKICEHLGPYISIASHVHSKHRQRKSENAQTLRDLFENPYQPTSFSGPIPTTTRMPRAALVRFLSRDSSLFVSSEDNNSSNKVLQAAPESTVGGAGLAQRYANVILLAESYLNSDTEIDNQARDDLYNMLPTSLRNQVKLKLKNAWRDMAVERSSADLAEGWREAVGGIMEWLGPIAQDTVTWQGDRNLEKQSFDSKPTLLLMQTLHYSDLEKTEAAIAEVLVGLSCVLWYENRRTEDLDCYDRFL